MKFDARAIDAEFGNILREKLTEVGYLDAMQSISSRSYPQPVIERILWTVDEELSSILQLFCLARRVPKISIPSNWNSILHTLQNCGVIRLADDLYTMAPLCLYVVEGILYFAEHPNPLFSVYFGEDSYALLSRKRLLAPSRGRVVDVCSGAGIQGLSYGGQASEIHLVELNPIAGKLAEINAAINFPHAQVDVHVTDLLEYLETESSGFDLVVCNPPLIPLPDCYLFNQVSHGGWDGLQFVRPIIAKIDRLLLPGGQFITVGVSACIEGIPEIERHLSTRLVGVDVSAQLTYLRRLPISKGEAWLSMIHDSLLNFGLGDEVPNLDSLADAYGRMGIDSVMFYVLSVVRPFYRSQDGLQLMTLDFTKAEGLEGSWKLR